MHQIMIALFVLLWLITDIHVVTGICTPAQYPVLRPAEDSM